jgi:hypothetical protein
LEATVGIIAVLAGAIWASLNDLLVWLFILAALVLGAMGGRWFHAVLLAAAAFTVRAGVSSASRESLGVDAELFGWAFVSGLAAAIVVLLAFWPARVIFKARLDR